MDYINPDLTWKTVAKGYRSSPRRTTRKHVLRNFAIGEELSSHQGSRELDEGTASDTEKQGVDILGQRFSYKIENIPLKKRRFMLRSNSPPPRSPSEAPTNENRQVTASGDGTLGSPENKSTEMTENAFDSSEDFSGMEILPAVACSNSTIGDVDLDVERLLLEESTRYGIGSCASETPVVKNVSSPKDMACEETDNESSLLGKPEGALLRPPITEEVEAVEGSVSANDDRLHWDLNVPEDAWEKPCDASTVDIHADASVSLSTATEGRIEVAKKSEVTVVSKDISDSSAKLLSLDVKEELPLGHCTSGQNGFEICGELDVNGKGRIPVSAANEHLVCEVADVKGTSKISGVNYSLGHLDTARNFGQDGDASTSPVSLVLEKAPHESDIGFIEDGQDIAAGISISDEKPVQCVPNMKCCADSQHVSCSVKVEPHDSDTGFIEDGQDIAAGISISNEKPVQCVPNFKSCADSQHVSCAVKVEPSFKESGGNMFASVVCAEGKSPSHERSEDMIQKSSGDSTLTPKEVSGIQDNGPTSSLANMTMGDPSHDSYGSDVYPAEKVGMVAAGSNNELQARYDSQFEDGELGESDARYYWDENEGEGGEVEHVDYGSEYGDEERLGSIHEKEVEIERGGSTPDSYDRNVECSGKPDCIRDDSVSPKSRVLDVPLEKGLASGLAETRVLQGEFASCAEGPDGRKNPYSRSRSENCRNGFPRNERDMGGPRRYFGRERVGMHMRGRSPGRSSGNPSTSYWNFERRYSPTRQAYLPGRPRLENNVEGRRYMMSSDRNIDSEEGGYFENRINRQFVNSPFERGTRRRSPSNRDDSYMNTRLLPMREMSPIRGRFRRFTSGSGRGGRGGIRDDFRRPLPEDSAEYPNRMGHRILKTDRSLSPPHRPVFPRPNIALPYRRSRSRSRSRSPQFYMQRREQQRNDGGGSVLRSRSPDGMRVRQPFQKRFAAKYDDRFTSPTRHHFSAHCAGPRPIDDHRGLDGFRGGGGRKSPPPPRMYRQQQQGNNNSRFDSQRPTRLDDDFGPARKFRDGVDANRANGGGEYEGSDDDRSKRNHRFEMPRPMPRRYDTEEGVGGSPMMTRRFRCNVDESFEGSPAVRGHRTELPAGRPDTISLGQSTSAGPNFMGRSGPQFYGHRTSTARYTYEPSWS